MMYYDRGDRKIKYKASSGELEICTGIFSSLTPGHESVRRWYISVRGANEYMHRDFSIQYNCGKSNMYDTQAEAEMALAEYNLRNGGKPLLPDELFEI